MLYWGWSNSYKIDEFTDVLSIKLEEKVNKEKNPSWFYRLILDWGRFHKTQMPKFVLQNAKIFMVFSLFNFMKALTPNYFHDFTPITTFSHSSHELGQYFQSQNSLHHSYQLFRSFQLERHVAQYLLPKNWRFNAKICFSAFLHQ